MNNFQVISGGNNRASAGKAADYPEEAREQHVARDGTEYATGYYSEKGGAPSEWLGSGAEAQGLAGSVNREDLINGFLGQIKDGPDISQRGGKTADAERRYAMDMTLSAPKSVSLIALAGGDERLIAAHQEAVRVAMAYVESDMVYARLGKGGNDSEFTGKAVIASYTHETSRTVDGVADPQLHSHNLILNQTQRADGTWTSARVDFGHQNEKFMTVDTIYKAELAKSVRAAGYEIEHTADGFEIKGISRDQIESFSRRKEQIDKALEENGLTRQTASARTRDNANTATRGNKSQLSDMDQRYEWRERLRETGINTDALKESARERADNPDRQAQQQRQPITGEDAVKSALHHLSERDTLFTETALLDESLKAGLGEVSYADVQKAISERAGGLVSAGEVDRGEGKSEPLFTTKAAIFREAEILHRAKDGQGKADAIIPAIGKSEGLQNQSVTQDVSFTEQEINDGKRSYRDAASSGTIDGKIGGAQEVESFSEHRLRGMHERGLDADTQRENSGVLPGNEGTDGRGSDDLRRANDDPRVAQIISDFEQRKGFSLGDGQKAAVALALTTEDQHIGIVGAAGAGKTTSMELIVEQYKAAGYEVIGVAPSAAAAKELESAGCSDTRTLASALLTKQEQKEGEEQPKRLYIMDESGMVSARDMDAFLQKVDNENARSILVGDPLQLAAVEAGSPYAQMLETDSIKHVKIDEIQRQKDPQLREIAQAFARGDAAQGVNLARPYMTHVQPQEADWEAAKMKQAEQPKKPEKFVQATEKMLDLAKDKGYEGSENFSDVRKFLDEKAYFVGINDANGGGGKGPLAPKEVRREALSRAAAEAYLSLSPDEREKTLLLMGTNDTRQAINEKIREGLKTEGTLGTEAVQITALDKLDLTREAATRAEKYVPKNPENSVIVKLNQDIKDKDGNLEAVKGSQWKVANNTEGKLTLESFDGQKREIVVDPAKVKLSAYESRKMDLAQGDQVMFRENNKERDVMNGQQAKIIGTNKETGNIIAETRAGDRITLNPARAESLDYSYARTVHSSQGATVERAIVVGEASKVSTAEAAYVACSREKTGLQIITDDMEKLGKSWSKFADKQSALDASKTKSPETYADLQKSRAEADRTLGHTGDLAKKRAAANEAAAQAGPTLGDAAAVPDSLDPDFGSDKFTEKVEAAMDKIQGKQQAASNAESEVLNAPSPTPASARDDETGGSSNDAPPPPRPEVEMERELGE